MRFDWDPAKAASNPAAHDGVTFDEASTIFGDALADTIFDEVRSTPDKERWLTMGMSDRGQLLVVWHTDDGEVIRIIGARRAEPRERRAYESGQQY